MAADLTEVLDPSTPLPTAKFRLGDPVFVRLTRKDNLFASVVPMTVYGVVTGHACDPIARPATLRTIVSYRLWAPGFPASIYVHETYVDETKGQARARRTAFNCPV